MPLLASKYRSGLDNLSIDVLRVKKIQLSKPNPTNPRLWITYFWGEDEQKREKIVRTWFYESEEERETELKRILQKYPLLKIE